MRWKEGGRIESLCSAGGRVSPPAPDNRSPDNPSPNKWRAASFSRRKAALFAIDPLWGVLFPPREAEKSSAATGLPLCADALSSTMIEASRLSPNARRHTPHRPLDALADPQSNLSAGRNAAARGDRLDCRAVGGRRRATQQPGTDGARRAGRGDAERRELPLHRKRAHQDAGALRRRVRGARRARCDRHLHARHVGSRGRSARACPSPVRPLAWKTFR